MHEYVGMSINRRSVSSASSELGKRFYYDHDMKFSSLSHACLD